MQIGIHFDKLDTNNWGEWKRRMRGLLKSKECWSVINKVKDEEEGSDKTKDSGKDDLAMGLMELHLGSWYLPMVDDCTTAKELWDKLEKMFQAQNNARRLVLRQQLNNLKLEKGEPVAKYIARAKSIASDLEGVGHKPEISELTLPVLAGLPEQYNVLVTVIGASKEDYTLDDILTMLLTTEQQINSRKEPVPIYGMRDFRHPHSESNKPSSSGNTSYQAPRCNYCTRRGHRTVDCRKRIADSRQKNTKRAVAFSASSDEVFSNDHHWVIDSGASRHLIPDRQQLVNYRSVEPNTAVTFVNGQQAAALGQGEVILQVRTASGMTEVTLQNVLHVPEATVSLFSTRQATNTGAVITFMNDGCSVSVNGTTVMEGISQQDGLMIIKQPKQQPAFAAAATSKSKQTPELWHRRYGHLGYDNLVKLKNSNMVEGIEVPVQAFKQQQGQQPVCEKCTAAKQTRQPFPESSSKSTRPLELVHMDVCGPMAVESHGAARYQATFVDDYSRLSRVVLLESKSQAASAIKQVITSLELQCGKSLKAVRTDRGGEYMSKELDIYFKDKGVEHQTTAPYTPEQNGVAERLNRTLMERVRAMLSDNNLDQELWAEAAQTANYVRNRSPSSHSNKTPWELFYGKKPDVSHMRVFGAKAYVHVPKQLRHKLESHSKAGIFVGYEEHSKAYRVLMDGKMEVCRDVIFEEKPAVKAEAEETRPEVTIQLPLGPSNDPVNTEKEDELGTDSQPSYSSSSEEEQGATAITEEAVEIADSSNQSLAAATSAQQSEQPRYPQRDRKQPKEIYRAMAASAIDTEEPSSHEEAISAPDAAQWKLAMDEEIAALAENSTWTLQEKPAGVKPIPVKWVFKIKKGALGNIERYKARLVAKGFMQREGIDFNEVFAPVSKHTTIRALLALAAAEDMEVHQLDIKTAFLNGELEETIYMQQPQGYGEGGPNTVCHLHKSLYGLKQSPRAWNTKLKQELESMGFIASEADPGLFSAQYKAGTVYILVYVDDILVVAKNLADVQSVKDKLGEAFKITDLGEAKYFLGISLDRDRQARTLKMTQERLATELVGKYGSLLYLSVCTRPDIAQAVGVLTRHMSRPSMEHWTAAKGVLRYIAGTLHHGVQFGKGSAIIEGYCDADYAADIDTRRSTTGWVFTMYGGAISWSSKLQPTVAASTSEAEYIAAAQAVKEALWLKKLLSGLGVKTGAMRINCDSQGAIRLLKHPIASNRTKHIDVVHHFARERVARKEVCFEYCNTGAMVADFLTKALPIGKFKFCCSGIGLV